MTTKLARIAEVARTRPKERFTSLMHLIDADMLRMCHAELKANRTTGVDGITKESNIAGTWKLTFKASWSASSANLTGPNQLGESIFPNRALTRSAPWGYQPMKIK